MPRTTRRPMSSTPQTDPVPMPEDVPTLQQHLRLARAQNCSLHGALARALKQGPLAPQGVSTTEETALALQSLREHYAVLKLHYADAQQKIDQLEYLLAEARKVMGWHLSEEQMRLVSEEGQLDVLRTQLIKLAHPDKWSNGQLATELAHEVMVVMNAAEPATLFSMTKGARDGRHD